MGRRAIDDPVAGPGPEVGRRAGGRHVLGGSLFVLAGLSLISFVALYRAPLPTDAFAALGVQLADAADTRSKR